ncbi:MAG: CPBP family intramembrane glutamic endopeptidase [Patescibacteria group bacterium]|jgi:membrane protease YdiL (CAAX protease family)
MENRTFGLRHVRNILTAYGLSWVWVVIVSNILQALLPKAVISSELPVLSVFGAWIDHFPDMATAIKASVGLSLFMTLVFAPVIEEAIFRMLPLTFVIGQHPERVRAVVIVICGIIFGWAHGSPLNVFIQGFVGLMLGWLYVKNNTSQKAAYISCVIVHALYNFTIVAMGG